MVGLAFVELSRYVEDRLGAGAWQHVLDRAGLDGRTYAVDTDAPDEEFEWLIATFSEVTDETRRTTLERLAAFVAPSILGGVYGSLVSPAWNLFDFIEHLSVLYRLESRASDRVGQARLEIERRGSDAVLIIYRSPRRMCAAVTGLVRGAARYYDETIEIVEPACVLEGADQCEIFVRRSEGEPPTHEGLPFSRD